MNGCLPSFLAGDQAARPLVSGNYRKQLGTTRCGRRRRRQTPALRIFRRHPLRHVGCQPRCGVARSAHETPLLHLFLSSARSIAPSFFRAEPPAEPPAEQTRAEQTAWNDTLPASPQARRGRAHEQDPTASGRERYPRLVAQVAACHCPHRLGMSWGCAEPMWAQRGGRLERRTDDEQMTNR